jgi:hypothetical protein
MITTGGGDFHFVVVYPEALGEQPIQQQSPKMSGFAGRQASSLRVHAASVPSWGGDNEISNR